MSAGQTKYVTDLKGWQLPRLEDLEDELVAKLRAEAPRGLDCEGLGAALYDQFLIRLRELVQTAVNETIEYWIKGLVDGNDGAYPELCVEFPYIERAEEVDPLTVAYAVDNEDGSRTELLRTTLTAALLRCLESEPPRKDRGHRTRALIAELRVLAERVEGVLAARS